MKEVPVAVKLTKFAMVCLQDLMGKII